MGESEERIVMTPRGKTANSTTIMVERRKVVSQEGNVHVGGGQHSGIIINKEARPDVEDTAAHLQLEFKVFLVNAQTQKHTQESRQLRFWFLSHVPEKERMRSAQEFFKELVAPLEFPRDYVGFIKKIMKMMQHKYKMISKVEVELKQLEESDSPPTRPTRAGAALYTVGCSEPDAGACPPHGHTHSLLHPVDTARASQGETLAVGSPWFMAATVMSYQPFIMHGLTKKCPPLIICLWDCAVRGLLFMIFWGIIE